MRQFNAGVRRAVAQLQFPPGGSALTAAFSRSGTLATIDLGTGGIEWTAPFPVHGVTCFAYSPDGSVLAVGGADGVARPYELPSVRCLAELRVGHTDTAGGHSPVFGIAFTSTGVPGRQWLAACGLELWLWNRIRQEYVCAPDAGYFHAVAFDPAGEAVATADDRAGGLSGYQIKPLRQLFQFRCATLTPFRRLAWVPDRDALLASNDSHVTCRGLDGRTLWDVPVPAVRGGADFALVPDGRGLVVGAGQGVRILDATTGNLVREYDWGVGKVTAVAVSPDGTVAAAGGEKGRVVVWDLDG